VNLSTAIGLAVMIGSEAATLRQVEPFYSWNTPICWTGFILFADGIVWQARRDSWLRSSWREFAALAAASIPLWAIFEAFNLRIENWYYTGLPQSTALRSFGYAWSFATISPAIFEAAEMVAVVRAGKPGRALRAHPAPPAPPALPAAPALPTLAGALLLASPFVVPRAVAPYMAAPVWLGFIFLFDPINAALGGEAISTDLRARRFDRLINLLVAGMVCGVLWEFWNYWAGAKWHYTVPIMAHVKIFEMPLPGYFGFPPFAVECFTMYVFVRCVYRRLHGGAPRGRAIAL
jgi:hypothetical protein